MRANPSGNKPMKNYEKSFAHYTKDLQFLSVGACPGCRECGLESEWVLRGPDGKTVERCGDDEEYAREAANEWNAENGSGYGVFLQEPTEHQRECTEEGGFSWSECDFCGSPLGGSRYPAHAILAPTPEEARDREISHFRVCADCLQYVANGELPEES